ncbi:MAG: acyl-CoA synthetase [Actinobacteria bacterium]|nr:acyl-CoA synthetase [Actinomycetota bacterium]
MTARLNLANLFEVVVDTVAQRDALVAADRRLTYAELDERINRLANHLIAQGVGPGDHMGLQLVNGTEYVEGMLAAFKLRAVPVNVNYRYVENELKYLFDDADLVALLVNEQFATSARAAAGPKLRHTLVVGPDGDYEAALAAASAQRPDDSGRTGDDLYCVYTGGTTGMPKGVMWRHEDIFFGAMGGGDPMQMGNTIKTPDELPSRIPDPGLTALATPPLMHASAHWTAFSLFFGGGTVVFTANGRFDPSEILTLIGQEKVNMLVIVGDAMARPLADELAAAEPGTYDTSSLIVIGSGGAILSPTMKEQIGRLLPTTMIVDGFGSSETGVQGTRAGMSDKPMFSVNEQTAVLDDDFKPIEPGSEQIGRLARRGHIPLGYYNDPEKTAKTFAEVDGVRWVLPGDMARVDAAGTVVLLGRGSVSINSGGEKIFPEEVEAALKGHPDVFDAVVVGTPDARWGEKVTAVIQPRGGATLSLDDVQIFCRDRIAGYKVPRAVAIVDEMVRSPSGKADYRWAKEFAVSALGE